MEELYMVKYERENGEENFLHSGRGFTPFVTSNISSAKAQCTKLSNRFDSWIVKIKEFEVIHN